MFTERQTLLDQISELQTRLGEAEEILRAIRHGEVDALAISGPDGDQVYTLENADRPYRVFVEAMQEGAVTLSEGGLVLYGNRRFAEMLDIPLENVLGESIFSFIAPHDLPSFHAILEQSRTLSSHGETTLRASDGTLMPVAIALSPLTLEAAMQSVCLVVTDLTNQHQREQEIRLLQQLQIVVTEANSFEEALRATLRQIIESTHWLYGEAWILSTDGNALQCASSYYRRTATLALGEFQLDEIHLTESNRLIPTAWRTQENFVISDIGSEARFARARIAAKLGLQASVITPVTAKNNTVAVLCFFTDQQRNLDEHFVRLTSTVAAQLGSFILRKQSEDALVRAHEELEQRVQERTAELQVSNDRLRTEMVKRLQAQKAEHEQRTLAEALRDTALTMNENLELPKVLKRILDNVDRVVAHETANIMLIDGEIAHIAGYHGYTEESLQDFATETRFAFRDEPVLAQIAQTGKPVVVNDTSSSLGGKRIGASQWRHAYAGLPIRSQGEVIGFLNITSATPDFFRADRVEALQLFADQAAVAIQNARLHQEAQMIAASKERERLAHELHDAVSQVLFSASVIAEALPRLWIQNPERVLEQLKLLHQLTQGAQAEMRGLLLELRPNALHEAQLKSLLLQLVNATKSRKQLDISVDIDATISLPPEAKLAFYRIAQEALNNVTKHSWATETTITLRSDTDTIEMIITDNGRGFDLGVIPSTSMGLGIMEERAAAIGASLSIVTAIGQGTQVAVAWAMPEEG